MAPNKNSIIRTLRRWRHRRGFGVHSPLGYRLVREVINQSKLYAWYCEREMARLHLSQELIDRGSMVARLTGVIKATEVSFAPGTPKEISKILSKMAFRHRRGVRLLVDINGKMPQEDYRLHLQTPGTAAIVFTDSRWKPEDVAGSLVITFANGWISVNKEGMARTVYEL